MPGSLLALMALLWIADVAADHRGRGKKQWRIVKEILSDPPETTSSRPRQKQQMRMASQHKQQKQNKQQTREPQHTHIKRFKLGQAGAKGWPDWMKDRVARLETAGVDLYPANTPVRLIGLAKVTHRGAVLDQGSLTVWPKEGSVLLGEWARPVDGCLLKVTEVAELREPIEISLRRQIHKKKTDEFYHVAMVHGSKIEEEALFFPVLPPNVSGLQFSSGQTVGDILRQWGAAGPVDEILAQVIPRPFGALLMHTLFRTIMVLGRCSYISLIFPLVGFPPADWMMSLKHHHTQAFVFSSNNDTRDKTRQHQHQGAGRSTGTGSPFGSGGSRPADSRERTRPSSGRTHRRLS